MCVYVCIHECFAQPPRCNRLWKVGSLEGRWLVERSVEGFGGTRHTSEMRGSEDPSFTQNRHNSTENRPLRALWRQKCVQDTKVLQTCAQLRPKIVARASKRAILRVLHNPLGRSGRPLGVQRRSQNFQEARKHFPKGCPRGLKRGPRGSPRPFLSA